MKQETVFSPCRKYRYTLWRTWSDLLTPDNGFVQFIGLNPSTADETQDDPTVRRCINFSKDWGFTSYCMTNLFAYRATQPKDMKAQADPVGSENDTWLFQVASKAQLVVCAWGNHGLYQSRGLVVLSMLCMGGLTSKLRHLGFTDHGCPQHPLYLLKTTKPQMFPV